MIHIAFADDQALFRKGMIGLINSFKGVRVMIEAQNGEELLERLAISDSPVQVALIDISMPVLNGIETMQQIRKKYPRIKNIILTVHEEEKYINKLIEEGANAYLAKNAEIEEVEKAIHAVVNNDYYFNEHTIQAMHNYMQGKKGRAHDLFDLTKREQEILLLICQEYTSPEIAARLYISERTVNGHRNNLLAKTGCKNTAGLVLFAIKNQLLDIDLR
ncbi:MAG: response regulator transcription factor [Ferruginibacter sp.]